MIRKALLIVLAMTIFAGCEKEPTESGSTSTTSPKQPKPTPKPSLAYLVVESDPPGAQVEVGLKEQDGVVTPGTGRIVGMTPCRVELKNDDISNRGGIYVLLKKEGHFEKVAGIGDALDKIAAGGEYKLSESPIKLNRIQ